MNPAVRERVEGIVARVREGGDAALRELAGEIDGYVPESFEVSEAEIAEASAQVPQELKDAVAAAAANIRSFHEAQMPRQVEVETAPGVRCIQRPVPVHSVGLYIPGGTAPLFSTVLMLAIPARTAGCREVVLCTPFFQLLLLLLLLKEIIILLFLLKEILLELRMNLYHIFLLFLYELKYLRINQNILYHLHFLLIPFPLCCLTLSSFSFFLDFLLFLPLLHWTLFFFFFLQIIFPLFPPFLHLLG